MPDPFENLGIHPIVNGYGPVTRFGGGIMAPEVSEAMRAATSHSVDIPELQAAASKVIAEATGAEAGIVTSGASAAILVGTAACLTGMDPGRMNRLPDTRGFPNEIIVVRSQRNSYDHALRAAGAVLVEVGLADRYTGAGVRDAEPWEIRDAITERTAAIFYLARPESLPPLRQVADVAHEAGLPVIVDAAAELPPLANLKRFITEGADLVAFSGGKAIGGPQGAGILCGRRSLVGAALLQQLDLDYAVDEWEPPASLVDRRNLAGLPRHGIGRSCKVGKEEIVGVLTALRLFTREGEKGRHDRLKAAGDALVAGLAGLRGVAASIIADPDGTGMPMVELVLDKKGTGLSAAGILAALRGGKPRIEIIPWKPEAGRLLVNLSCLRASDPALIAARLKEIVAAG